MSTAVAAIQTLLEVMNQNSGKTFQFYHAVIIVTLQLRKGMRVGICGEGLPRNVIYPSLSQKLSTCNFSL